MAVLRLLVRFPAHLLDELFDLDGFHRVVRPRAGEDSPESLELGKYFYDEVASFAQRALVDTLHEAASGRHPFVPSVPPHYSDRRNQELYARDRDAKYATADEVVALAERLEAVDWEAAAVKPVRDETAAARAWGARLRSFYGSAARAGQAVVSFW